MRPYFLLEPGDGLLLCSADGRILHVDRTARSRLGHHANQWSGDTVQTWWPQLADLIVDMRRTLADGPRDHVLPLPKPNGLELATRVRLFCTDSGFGVGILRRRGHRDPTDQRETAEASYRRLLEAVLDTAQDAVLVTLAEPLDLPGPVIVYANRSLLEQTGYGLHEVLGRSPRMFQGPETCPRARRQLRRAMNDWQPAEMEVINYRRDGSPCWIELKLAPLAEPDGWFSHWVSVQRDVSERVEREQRLLASAPLPAASGF